MMDQITFLREAFFDGGFMMWPLGGCSLLLVAYLIERFWTIGIRYRIFRNNLPIETRKHHRSFLPFFSEVPPSMGLLGTVIGLVMGFGSGDTIDANSVASGLGVACYTTIAGLAIALIASISGYVLEWASK